jgi:NTP pyrophosphatase (non-canonical NTP hydrolase)
MDLTEIQAEVIAWQTENFGDVPAWRPLLKAQEELGELAGAHAKALEGERDGRARPDHEALGKDALGDTIIALLGYAGRMGWDAAEILETVWAEVRERRYGDPPNWRDDADDLGMGG